MILGDNIIEGSIAGAVAEFKKQERGAKILLKEVQDAERFGVAEICRQQDCRALKRSLTKPKSRFAVTGIYMYDGTRVR